MWNSWTKPIIQIARSKRTGAAKNLDMLNRVQRSTTTDNCNACVINDNRSHMKNVRLD